MARFVRLLVALVLVGGVAGASAEGIGGGDAATIRSLIEGQIDAFRHDDGAAAYAFASPTIHGIFPNADRFMEMVRQGYQPVYRPKSVTFGPIVDSPMGPLQKVYLVGPDGKDYVAVYTLERQPDGTWKINGCVIVPDDASTI